MRKDWTAVYIPNYSKTIENDTKKQNTTKISDSNVLRSATTLEASCLAKFDLDVARMRAIHG